MPQDGLRKLFIGRENVEGITPTYMRMLPVLSYKPDPKDMRFTPKEYTGTRIRELDTVKLYQHEELSFDFYVRYDTFPWVGSSILGAATSTKRSTPTPVASQQRIELSIAPTGGTMSLVIDGYDTGATAAVTSATDLATKLQALLVASPAVGAGNATVVASSSNTELVITSTGTNATRVLQAIGIGTNTLTGASSAAVTAYATGNIQRLTFVGGPPTSATFILIFTDNQGVTYTTASIAWSATDATLLTNIQTALNTTLGAGAALVLNPSAGVFDIILQGANFKDLRTAITRSMASIGATPVTLAISNPSFGVGVYDHIQKGGGSNMPTLSIIEFDGVSYTKYNAFSVDSADFDFSKTAAVKCSIKGISKFEARADDWATLVPSTTEPALVKAPYSGPVDPTQLLVTFGGTSFSLLHSGKLSIKNNRTPINTIGGGTDMIRAEEGEFTAEFNITARYLAYTGSQYAAYLANTSPGALVIKGTNSGSALSGGVNPAWEVKIPNPKYTQGGRDPMQNEITITNKGMALLDTVLGTSIQITTTNDIPSYAGS